jgi:hypothetical protein
MKTIGKRMSLKTFRRWQKVSLVVNLALLVSSLFALSINSINPIIPAISVSMSNLLIMGEIEKQMIKKEQQDASGADENNGNE